MSTRARGAATAKAVALALLTVLPPLCLAGALYLRLSGSGEGLFDAVTWFSLLMFASLLAFGWLTGVGGRVTLVLSVLGLLGVLPILVGLSPFAGLLQKVWTSVFLLSFFLPFVLFPLLSWGQRFSRFGSGLLLSRLAITCTFILGRFLSEWHLPSIADWDEPEGTMMLFMFIVPWLFTGFHLRRLERELPLPASRLASV